MLQAESTEIHTRGNGIGSKKVPNLMQVQHFLLWQCKLASRGCKKQSNTFRVILRQWDQLEMWENVLYHQAWIPTKQRAYYSLWSPSRTFFKSNRCYMLRVGTSKPTKRNPWAGGTSFAHGWQTGSRRHVGSVNPVPYIRPLLKRRHPWLLPIRSPLKWSP